MTNLCTHHELETVREAILTLRESEQSLMAKRMARRRTKRQRTESEKRLTPLMALKGTARRNIEEIVTGIHRCCSDEKWTAQEKRVACVQLVELALLSTANIFRLAAEFREPFQEIAENLRCFPCAFPAHVDDLQSLQKRMWNDFKLGKRDPLKLRAAPGRKTFSTKTLINKLLIDLIKLVTLHAALADLDEREHDSDDREGPLEGMSRYVPLTPENAKKWLDAIWKLLLIETPNPENHPRLRQLVDRPSLRRKRLRRDGTVGEKTQAHNMRAAIKSKLGVYLKRMLNDSAVHK